MPLLRSVWILLGALLVGLLVDWGTGDWSVRRPGWPVVLTVACAYVYVVWQASRAPQRLVRWLKSDPIGEPPELQGAWGDLAQRAFKLLRVRDREVQLARDRLESFLSALQASPNGVILLDPSDRIDWLNQSAAQHFGLDGKRDHQQYIGNLVRDPGFAHYLGAESWGLPLVIPGRFVAGHPISLSVRIFAYGDGRKLMLSSDVTQMEQAEAMRRDFVANVSHEIRTPLTVLAGFVETMQTIELSPGDIQRYLDTMSQQTRRLQALVSDLLTLSRLEGSPPPGFETAVDVDELWVQLVQDARTLSGGLAPQASPRHHIQAQCTFDGQILGDGSELLSAMSNLVSNAIRYTPAGGTVGLSLHGTVDGGLRFAVTDTGPGIAPEHLSRLTERFYRVDRSRSRETGGTGLGLAIAKHVAQRHDARLDIQSKPGEGSTFALIWPPARVRRYTD